MSREQDKPTSTFSNFIQAAGVILGISYPVLALSTGFRAVFQIIEGEAVNAPWLTMLGALFYLTATIGFFKREKWAWRLSVGILLVETVFTFVIGGLSFIDADLVGRNVWQFFGRDYGYLPLIQPLLGLAWLFNRDIMWGYGLLPEADSESAV